MSSRPDQILSDLDQIVDRHAGLLQHLEDVAPGQFRLRGDVGGKHARRIHARRARR